MNQIATTIMTAAMVSALAACANAEEPMVDGTSTDEPRTCMFVRNIETYRPLSRNHVVIVDQAEETFLLATLRPSCWEIMRSAAIALESGPISLCAGDAAVLQVRGERCYIRSLEAVLDMEAAETLVEQRSDDGGSSSR